MGLDISGGGGLSTAQVGALLARPMRTGGTVYYTLPFATSANVALVQNTLYAHALCIPSQVTLTKLGVVTTGVALSSARLGIYSDAAGVPGPLVLDAGTVATTAGGLQTKTISQLLTPGWYWFAAAVQGAAGNLNCVTNTDGVALCGTTAPFSGPMHGFSQTAISGALPSPWGGTLTETAQVPLIWIAAQ